MKLGKGFRLYALVTQYLFQTFALAVIGIYGGSKLDIRFDTGTTYSGILGIVGVLIGITTFIVAMYRDGVKNGKKSD